MTMNWQGLLVTWTLCALIWWLMAVLLVLVANARRQPENHKSRSNPQTLTIFKPLAGPLSSSEFLHMSRCLETFVADLDEHSELLIGCYELDQTRWQEFIEGMCQSYPGAHLKLVTDPDPKHYAANPKISWMKKLVSHATGELWYWSDADIEAPPGMLQSLRNDFASSEVQLVTSPYTITNVPSAAALLDALFVNLEFYPGVILLGKLNAIEFGFGSGMLFNAETFRQRVDLEFLGTCLADDYHLGRLLQPAKLGSMRLSTTPAAETWRGAVLHYLRWQKTIRWNRPGGFAAQLFVLPVIGWLIALCIMPTEAFVWWGLVATLGLDFITVIVISHLLRCRIAIVWMPIIPLWTILRSVTWLACWFPWPIIWRDRKWWSAYQSLATDDMSVDNKPAGAKDVK